jgi:hypothetical protein
MPLKQITPKQISHKPDRFRAYVLVTLFLFLSGGRAFPISLPGKDSLKIQYDRNDPRNPDCPCHQYQRQAEKEYAALMSKEQPDLQKNSRHKTQLISLSSTRFIHRWMLSRRRNKVKHFHPDYLHCPRWY